eukprot:CAMPEP_0114548080 /NCGR_PEP_ID=MMETSP0114-20121206/4790_1 /TAXON_ID=31324 /ORGANISM="Goniomonas sp, Strain m" /LENGTH=307 /DNA_ID=CAMNT_0001732645 /DNA_START=9 /DNA_END=932 /DNA_ORIENTATION=-
MDDREAESGRQGQRPPPSLRVLSLGPMVDITENILSSIGSLVDSAAAEWAPPEGRAAPAAGAAGAAGAQATPGPAAGPGNGVFNLEFFWFFDPVSGVPQSRGEFTLRRGTNGTLAMFPPQFGLTAAVFESLGSLAAEISAVFNENRNNGNPAASPAAIASLPTVQVAKDTDATCPICQESLAPGSTATSMPCSHLFHNPCLVPWLNQHNTCPTCRCEIETEDLEYNTANSAKIKAVIPSRPVAASAESKPSRRRAQPDTPPPVRRTRSAIAAERDRERSVAVPEASPPPRKRSRQTNPDAGGSEDRR